MNWIIPIAVAVGIVVAFSVVYARSTMVQRRQVAKAIEEVESTREQIREFTLRADKDVSELKKFAEAIPRLQKMVEFWEAETDKWKRKYWGCKATLEECSKELESTIAELKEVVRLKEANLTPAVEEKPRIDPALLAASTLIFQHTLFSERESYLQTKVDQLEGGEAWMEAEEELESVRRDLKTLEPVVRAMGALNEAVVNSRRGLRERASSEGMF